MGSKSKRLNQIIALLKKNETMSVKNLSDMLHVSEMTIRRDLNILEADDIIIRSHGKATYKADSDSDLSDYELYSEKTKMNIEKDRIGQFAAGLIEPGDIVIIDNGSTTDKLTKYIPEDISITVLCYNFNVLEQLVKKQTIVIGCDNAAVSMKKMLTDFLEEKGIIVENMGCDSPDDPTNYPTIAKRVCEKIIESGYTKRGILVCGTGIGMSITANKFKGIRAAVCHENYSAERSVLSNNCNVLCMGERVIGYELAKKVVGEWITLEFKDGRSTPKVQEIIDIEKENFK